MSVKRSLAGFCLSLILFTLFTPAVIAQEDWYKFTGPEGDFTVEFPGSPINERVPVSDTGEHLQIYYFNYGNYRLELNYKDLRSPAAAKIHLNTYLSTYVRDYTQSIVEKGGQVFRRSTLPDGGMELVSKYLAGRLRETVYEQSRVYVRGSRRYVISCTSLSDSGIDQTFAIRFFSSLHLYGLTKAHRVADNNPVTKGATVHVRMAAEIPWYKFVSPDRDFEVEFPAKPRYETRAHPQTGAEMQGVHFLYGPHDFGIISSELLTPPATTVGLNQWLASAAERYLRATQSKLIRETRLADGALEIESKGQLNGKTVFMRARIYVRGTRGYQVDCSSFGENQTVLDDPMPARFFASFRLK